MQLIFTSLFHVDHENNSVSEIEINNAPTELMEYANRLTNEITKSPRKREFTFHNDTTQIRKSIDSILAKDYENVFEDNAKRLLRIEIDAQSRYGHLNELQKGSLFHAHMKVADNEEKIIICKVEHDEFLDDTDFITRKGMSWKKKAFKAVLINIEHGSIGSVFVYDTNSTISKYWWFNYLELEPIHSDKYNTETALDKILKKIINPIRQTSPRDYTLLRNATVGFFQTRVDFDLTAYSDLVKDYLPENKELPIDKYVEKIQNLTEVGKKFDNRFTISKQDIKRRMINDTISLTNSLDLQIKGYVKEFEDMVQSEKDKEGNKYIRIKSDKGYEYFKDKLDQ